MVLTNERKKLCMNNRLLHLVNAGSNTIANVPPKTDGLHFFYRSYIKAHKSSPVILSLTDTDQATFPQNPYCKSTTASLTASLEGRPILVCESV
jgi:hypothetical protein